MFLVENACDRNVKDIRLFSLPNMSAYVGEYRIIKVTKKNVKIARSKDPQSFMTNSGIHFSQSLFTTNHHSDIFRGYIKKQDQL